MEYDNDGETLKVWNIMYIVAKDEEVALDIPRGCVKSQTTRAESPISS